MGHLRILVLGYFANTTKRLDGQIAKTKEIYNLISIHNKDKWQLDCFDTELFKYKKWAVIILFLKLLLCDRLIYLPGQNNLRKFGKLLYYYQRLRNFSVIYIGIGGWLVDFLVQNPSYVKIFRRYTSIMVENSSVVENLKSVYNFTNAICVPNFRIHNYIPQLNNSNARKFRIVFMSRIMRDKGIDTVFAIIENLKEYGFLEKVELMFYGPLSKKKEEQLYFEENLAKYNNVQYGGVLQMNDIYITLNKYDVMLFPSRYEGEGFPGAILDAFISGIPVIASNWKYNSSIIQSGYNGIICSHNDIQEYIDALKILMLDKEILLKMKVNAYESSQKYSSDEVWKELSLLLNS